MGLPTDTVCGRSSLSPHEVLMESAGCGWLAPDPANIHSLSFQLEGVIELDRSR